MKEFDPVYLAKRLYRRILYFLRPDLKNEPVWIGGLIYLRILGYLRPSEHKELQQWMDLSPEHQRLADDLGKLNGGDLIRWYESGGIDTWVIWNPNPSSRDVIIASVKQMLCCLLFRRV